MERVRTYGAEIEKPVANLKTGDPHGVSQDFFRRLGELSKERGRSPHYHHSDISPDKIIGVSSDDIGNQGLDNGWNLLEGSLPYKTSLFELEKLMTLDLQTVQQALKEEGATVVNLSIHPLGRRDFETYRAFVAPKGIYPYLWYRGWDHTAGIDARAQNSPTTGVDAWEAADAVSVIIGAGAAFIGLFANSPYEEGKRSKYKESRCAMWERMMKYSKIEGDRTTAQFPPQRFFSLAQYFNWMFGKGTSIHFVLADNPHGESDYKGTGDRILIVEGNPSVLEYLSQPQWQAYFLTDLMNNFPPQWAVRLTRDISHLAAMQFAQFAGARVRYNLKHKGFPLQEFLAACDQPNAHGVEKIFEIWAEDIYIEGREPGANFPDQQLWDVDDKVARSVVIAPSAIQAGLIRNLPEAIQFIDSFNWRHLKALRDAAIRDGLQGESDGVSVRNFARQILEIAARGLSSEEQKLLRYPEWVLETGKNGADRAIEYVESHRGGDLTQALRDLVRSRTIVL